MISDVSRLNITAKSKTKTMAVVVRITDGSLTPEEIVRSLPDRMTAIVIRSWVEVKKVGSRKHQDADENPSDSQEPQGGKVRTRNIYHGYVLVDKSGIEPIMGYARVQVFSNFYPRRFDDPYALYVKLTPAEKVAALDFINAFCATVKASPPSFITMNGYGFINFDDHTFVPMIAGALRRLPALRFATVYYGRLKEAREDQGEGESSGETQSAPPNQRSRGVPRKILKRAEEVVKEEVEEEVQALKKKAPRARRQKVADADGFVSVTRVKKTEETPTVE